MAFSTRPPRGIQNTRLMSFHKEKQSFPFFYQDLAPRRTGTAFIVVSIIRCVSCHKTAFNVRHVIKFHLRLTSIGKMVNAPRCVRAVLHTDNKLSEKQGINFACVRHVSSLYLDLQHYEAFYAMPCHAFPATMSVIITCEKEHFYLQANTFSSDVWLRDSISK